MCKWTAWQLLSECWWREGNKRPLTVAAGIFQVLSVHSHMDSALDSCTEGGRLVFARWWGTTRQSPTLCEEEAAFLLTCTVSAAPGLCPAHSGMWKEQSLFGPLPLLAEGRQCGRIMSGLLQPGHFRSCSLAQRSHLARTTLSEWILNPPAWGRESRHFDNNTIYHSEYCFTLQVKKWELWDVYWPHWGWGGGLDCKPRYPVWFQSPCC